MVIPLLLACVVGYLLGALPFGYIVARAHGVNIFEVGSKSPGATNVRRVLGRRPGNLVLMLDGLKGAVAAGWLLFLPANSTLFSGVRPVNVQADMVVVSVVCLLASIVGHSYSCFTKFHGGKGVATAAGGLLVLMPWVLAISLGVWFLTFNVSRYVSLASILAALTLPVAAYFLGEPFVHIGLVGVIAVFVTFRHRANLVRLLNGTENKFVKKAAVPDTPRP